MELVISVLRFLGLVCIVLLVADWLVGNLWATKLKQFFEKMSEIMLKGAVIDTYHKEISAILNFADKRIGRFIPRISVFVITFSTFTLMQLAGGLVQAIQENIPFATIFWIYLFSYPLVATLSASFCYTITYMVLYLINNGDGPFLLRYIYLVTVEILVSYILAPSAYASMFFFADYLYSDYLSPDTSLLEIKVKTFGDVISTWPYAVIEIGWNYVYDFQSTVNVGLLFISIILCVLPTFLHVCLLIVDFFRFIFKHICERLMETFDSWANSTILVRRFLLGAPPFLASVEWIIR